METVEVVGFLKSVESWRALLVVDYVKEVVQKFVSFLPIVNMINIRQIEMFFWRVWPRIFYLTGDLDRGTSTRTSMSNSMQNPPEIYNTLIWRTVLNIHYMYFPFKSLLYLLKLKLCLLKKQKEFNEKKKKEVLKSASSFFII